MIDIIDGRFGQEGLGPHFGDAFVPGFMLFGRDPVAIDSACARLIGFIPSNVATISAAYGAGLGNIGYGSEDVIGDAVVSLTMKPSPEWEFTLLDEAGKKILVFWLEDSQKGLARIYGLNDAQQIFDLSAQQIFQFSKPITRNRFIEWLINGRGIQSIGNLPEGAVISDFE